MPPSSLTVSRPSLALFTTEPLRAAGELLHHLIRPLPAATPASDGHAVVLFPGLAANALSMWPLRRYLSGLGYAAIDWGQGFNTGPVGDVDDWLKKLCDRVLALADQIQPAGRNVSLVGWSLGGLYAREIAKLAPQRVRGVITIGTPFNSSEERSNVAWLLKLLNRRAPPDTAHLRARLAAAPPVPSTAIYSRQDGVVAWQTCRHGGNACGNVNDIEIRTSHLGMGWNRTVLSTVARELAAR